MSQDTRTWTKPTARQGSKWEGFQKSEQEWKETRRWSAKCTFMDTIFDFDSLDPVDPDTEQGNQFQGPVASSSSSTWRPCDLVL